MEDAINQLQVLGVTRGQAKRALARYNNDVARAADYIFSGAELSDEDDEDYNNDMNIDASVIDEKMETDKEMAIRFSLEEQENHTTAPKAYLDKAATFTSQKPAAAPDWSVVPFTAKEPNVTSIPPSSSSSSFSAASSHSTMTAQTSVAGRYNSLTWWSDPENPNERKALRNIPIGLRPPSSNCAYSPILIQALFHITAFQQLILAYRPIPYTYGGDHAHASTSKEYWRGYGEPVPGYILREVKTKVPIVKSTSGTDYSLSTTAPTLPIASEIPTSIIPTESVSSANSHYSNTDYITDKTVDNLVNVDVAVDTMQKLTLHEDNSFNNDNLTDWNIEHMDTPFNETITSTPFASNIEEVEYEERYENELQCVPKSVQALAELQKIFGFLGFSKRRYGNIAHFTRALNASGQEASVAIHMPRTSLNNNSRLDWKYNEKSFDAFIEMLITCLLEAGNYSDDIDYEANLKRLFQWKAKVIYGYEEDTEEVNFLTLNIHEHMNSIHLCLDPLMYESLEPHQIKQDGINRDECDPSISDSEQETDEKEQYRFTTFTEIPPILMIILEDRDEKRTTRFNIEQTVYFDRYLEEKKAISLEGFKQMDTYRKEIRQCRLDLERLSNSSNASHHDNFQTLSMPSILDLAMDHFCSRQQFEEEDDTSGEDPLTPEDIELVQSSISKIKQSIVARIEDLEARIESHQQKMASIFNNRDDLKDYPYSLRASFHHDGLSGTGHHWAYIWVEPAKPAEENLLQDIPLDAKSEQRNCDEHARGGGWFKFCDASVEPVTENDIYADPVSPFALLYTAADSNAKTLPRFTKEQLYNDWMPNTLKEFITADNELFEKELYSYNNPSTIMDEVVVEEPIGPSATSYTSPFHNISKAAYEDSTIEEDIPLREKQGSVHYENEHVIDENMTYHSPNYNNPFVSAINRNATSPTHTFNVNNPFLSHAPPTLDKDSNQVQIESNHQSNNSSYLFSGQPFLKLRDRVNNEIVRVSTFPKDDYRLLKSFEVFLARTQHHLNLEHLYLLYSKDKAPSERYNMVDNNVDEDEIEADYIVDEKAAKEDSELKLIWKEYESYSAIGTMITQALIYFSKKDFANALQQFLDTKRVEASWKTQVMLDTDLSTAYSGLESISFNDLVKRFGKACLQILNRQAYMKAINPELRTIGLQDAIKIAQQAQMIIGPDYIQEDPLYQTFKEVWLSFTENPNVMAEGTLTSQQAELLNSLFMIYLEGHVGGIDYSARSSATVSRCTSPVSSEHTDFDSQTDNELPIWQRYKEACEEANQLLSSLSD